MTQDERRLYILRYLLNENRIYADMEIPADPAEQWNLIRSLMNVRIAAPASREFLEIQDAFLREETEKKGITDASSLIPCEKGIYLWQGDITTLRCGAIVNAANSGMTGCYHPLHNCIDNCIHTYAGIQLRNYCADIMEKQGCEEPTGRAKITPAFNLPCDYVIHTVGPIVRGSLTDEHIRLLESCYLSCLETAKANKVESLAFCCISTGVFMFPAEKAAETAITTVRKFIAANPGIKVIFNVFSDKDKEIYGNLLKKERM